VKINNVFSAWHSVISGRGPIPQGIVSSDLCCCDFHKWSPWAWYMYRLCRNFSFHRWCKNCSNMSDQLQRSCDRLFQWSNQWLLRLNI